ncbi:lipopolysaccharide transport periplasmic protein LptA [Shimia haliotis]|uniref:Lipopolysaccharide export system protein LptA n=1 Tax=Shimia haliotis TaxID=1280847 RepID=A0A1I4END2_9RHOB|nr:lipopolysaccharide transport periplasmic protein LptA [Shimia haliotis]SFL06713.1 lipopolysaccharide export system protein LptA [Shimia haliotis]
MLRALLIMAVSFFPAFASAQGIKVGFGDMKQDSSLPVEVTAESLSVNQNDGSAVFSGDVKITQGAMHMTADKVNVFYQEGQVGIARLVAEGNVLLVQGSDAAEAQKAEYSIENGSVVMSGDVMVVQQATTITADSMSVNLNDNTAQMHGQVKTILRNQ